MTPTSTQQTKLLKLLRELFQLDQPDLDFGLYRIMHAKAREIERFLDEDLLDPIRKTMGGNKDAKIAMAKAAYERERQNAIDYGGNPDNSPKVQQALAEYKVAQESQDEDAQLYDHLYRFFERYYQSGDFLSRRYYARETSEKAAPYAVPYDGSEVYLHWANKDQYYIKTAESFRQFSVDLALAKAGDKQLFDDGAPRKVHFTLVEVEESAHNNVKVAKDKDRFFILDAQTPLEWQGEELAVRFHYRADPDKTGQAGKWRTTRNESNEQGILNALAQQAQGKNKAALLAQEFHQALATVIAKGKAGETQTLLAKYLNQYTAKNSMDYFIHKDLGSFLKRELDFYIKNEVFRLDGLGNADAPNSQQFDKLLKNALTLREVAHKLIVFLAQTEDFQKKLWLKKKFVVDTQWLVTLDKVPANLYPQVESNEAQWAEWVKLGFVAPDAKRHELLKQDSFLVLDTQFFVAEFTAKLLASIVNLDESTDGVLVHSENFQALNLMQARYKEQVKCIYIDPPYNTNSTPILYKNEYKHSSWASLMQDRLALSMRLLNDDGVKVVAIDDSEMVNLSIILENTAPSYKLSTVSVVHNPKGSITKDFNRVHEYALFLTKADSKTYIARILEKNDKPRKMRRWGENSLRVLRRPSFYPIYVREGKIIRIGLVPDDEFHPDAKNVLLPNGEVEIWPIDQDGEERRWNFGLESIHRNLDRVIPIEVDGAIDLFVTHELTVPKTVWTGGEFDAGNYGNTLLIDMFGEKRFDFPKSINLVKRCVFISTANDTNPIILDYFGGSATTGHAVIDLNRKDKEHRKYIIVEQGEYFDSITKPRIAKVIYSADWKDGKPSSPETGISQLVKVIRLESYEDTLNNLHIAEESAQHKLIEANPILREDYYLHYLLEMETQGSPSLLNISAFADPTAYTLSIKKPGSDAQEHHAVDLVETFNWLIGLRVTKLHAPQTFAAFFALEADSDLPSDAQKRLVLKGKLKELAPSPSDNLPPVGEESKSWWFRSVQGIVNGSGASSREERTLVVWRKFTGNLEQDSIVLEAWLRETLNFDVRQNQNAAPFDVIYVNGSHALPLMPQCEVRQLEDAFHRLMWDVQDV